MFEVGQVLHKARSGRLIIRLSKKVEPGSLVLDSKGKSAGKVIELIGPVAAPYASVMLSEGAPERQGSKIYSPE